MMFHQTFVLFTHSPNQACVWTVRVGLPLALLRGCWSRTLPLLAGPGVRGSTALSQPHLPGLWVLWGFRWLRVVTFHRLHLVKCLKGLPRLTLVLVSQTIQFLDSMRLPGSRVSVTVCLLSALPATPTGGPFRASVSRDLSESPSSQRGGGRGTISQLHSSVTHDSRTPPAGCATPVAGSSVCGPQVGVQHTTTVVQY